MCIAPKRFVWGTIHHEFFDWGWGWARQARLFRHHWTTIVFVQIERICSIKEVRIVGCRLIWGGSVFLHHYASLPTLQLSFYLQFPLFSLSTRLGALWATILLIDACCFYKWWATIAGHVGFSYEFQFLQWTILLLYLWYLIPDDEVTDAARPIFWSLSRRSLLTQICISFGIMLLLWLLQATPLHDDSLDMSSPILCFLELIWAGMVYLTSSSCLTRCLKLSSGHKRRQRALRWWIGLFYWRDQLENTFLIGTSYSCESLWLYCSRIWNTARLFERIFGALASIWIEQHWSTREFIGKFRIWSAAPFGCCIVKFELEWFTGFSWSTLYQRALIAWN